MLIPWALDKAKEGLNVGAEMVRDYTRSAMSTYTRREPIRALLIAAGTGALLMALIAILAHSGYRKVVRKRIGAVSDAGTSQVRALVSTGSCRTRKRRTPALRAARWLKPLTGRWTRRRKV